MIKKIGLAGKSGSGKNVIADMICSKYGYQQIAVADGIRQEVAQFIRASMEGWAWNPPNSVGWVGCLLPVIEELPGSFEVVLEAFEKAVYAKPTPPEIRVMLQWWGTEYRRSKDPDYWIKQLSNRLDNDFEIVISDVRLPDEMKTIRAHGGEVWLIERDGISHVGIAGHLTEHALEDVEFDRVIQNNGTLDDLENCIETLFRF
jgi:hypothetical protein